MKQQVTVCPHDELMNLAFYHLKRAEEKIAVSEDMGISYDCASSLVFIAFSNEALLNLAGSKIISKWKERNSYRNKMNLVFESMGIGFDDTDDPYKTFWEIKGLRDWYAHGIPFEGEVHATSLDELRRVVDGPWEHLMTVDYARHSLEISRKFRQDLVEKGKMEFADIITSFIDDIPED